MTKTVYVATAHHGKARKVYHTEKDCQKLKLATNIKEWERRFLHDDWNECLACQGEITQEKEPESLARVLRQNPEKRQEIIDKISGEI